jgi:hypothetical protein
MLLPPPLRRMRHCVISVETKAEIKVFSAHVTNVQALLPSPLQRSGNDESCTSECEVCCCACYKRSDAAAAAAPANVRL